MQEAELNRSSSREGLTTPSRRGGGVWPEIASLKIDSQAAEQRIDLRDYLTASPNRRIIMAQHDSRNAGV